MNTVQIEINGTQSFMGKEIPVVRGGFGKDKKCVCDKTVAELHNQPMFKIRERITNNIQRFTENVDFIDLKQRIPQTDTSKQRIGGNDTLVNDLKKGVFQTDPYKLLISLGYAKQSITQADHIYLFSQRGYLKLVKIMDSDTAWETYNELLDKYFMMEEEQTKAIPQGKHLLALALVEANKMLEEKETENTMLKTKIEEDKPKVILAEAISVSDTCILIREFVKVLKQNGIDTGEKRFYNWLKSNGYLIKKEGHDCNTPTQKSMDLKLFELKETPIYLDNRYVKIVSTTYLTAKGQSYFIDKLLNKTKGQKQLTL